MRLEHPNMLSRATRWDARGSPCSLGSALDLTPSAQAAYGRLYGYWEVLRDINQADAGIFARELRAALDALSARGMDDLAEGIAAPSRSTRLYAHTLAFGYFSFERYTPTLTPPEEATAQRYLADSQGSVFQDDWASAWSRRPRPVFWVRSYRGSLHYHGPRTQLEWVAYHAHGMEQRLPLWSEVSGSQAQSAGGNRC